MSDCFGVVDDLAIVSDVHAIDKAKETADVSHIPAADCFELWCNKMSSWNDICHKDHYPGPPGGLLYPSSPVHPWDMSNFPFLKNVCSRTHVSPWLPSMDNALPFPDTLLELRHDSILPFLSCMRVSVNPTATSSLADGGTNVCIMNNSLLLVDVIEIEPIPLELQAVKKDSNALFCMHKGFLPMTRLDSSMHYQPFLVCLDATDTILSPEHIINNNHTFSCWCQEGSKVGLGDSRAHPGCLSFYGQD
jgi:hypothetical protein